MCVAIVLIYLMCPVLDGWTRGVPICCFSEFCKCWSRKTEINVCNNLSVMHIAQAKKTYKDIPQNVFCYFIKQMYSKRVQCQFAGCLVGDVRPWSHFEAPWNKPGVAECVFFYKLYFVAPCLVQKSYESTQFRLFNAFNWLESLINLIIDWYFATWSSCPWGLGRCSSQDGCSQTWSCARTSTLRGSPQSSCRWCDQGSNYQVLIKFDLLRYQSQAMRNATSVWSG